ncbi:MAG TPA: NifU family protein [Bacillota bacterium]
MAEKVQEQQDLFDRISQVIDRIRPAIQMDGGDVELVDVEDGIVKLRLMGACVGCPMSTMTLQAGIERMIRQEVPEIKGVMSV